MSDEVMRLPGSSFFFKKICQLNISLKNEGKSIYWLKEDYWYSYDDVALVVFENDLHEWYLKFHKEIESEVPFILVDNEKRYRYYQDLLNITEKYHLLLSIVSEFLNEIRPDQNLSINYCKRYFSGEINIIEEKASVIIQDIRQMFYLSIDHNYDFVDLWNIRKKMAIHSKYLSLAKSFLSEKLPKSLISQPQLKWRPNISILGYLFLQLAQKGYIELPTAKGNANFTEMGRVICSLFGIEATASNLKRFQPKNHSLGAKNIAQLQLPEADDLQ